MKKLFFFLLIILFILVGFSLFFWLYEVKFFVGRAAVTAQSFSIDNSYLFTTPLRAMANGQEKIRVTVFILNNQGLGVMGKTVQMGPDKNLVIETIQGLTDGYGKAYFDVSSTHAGDYFLQITADGKALKQQVHLSFY